VSLWRTVICHFTERVGAEETNLASVSGGDDVGGRALQLFWPQRSIGITDLKNSLLCKKELSLGQFTLRSKIACPGKLIQPSLMFADKAQAYLNEALFRNSTLG
jgi:hypothetical protein